MLKISVIVPSFNQGRFLEETILSILEQDYPLLEVFVIDGGSTDNSKEIIQKYENRLSGWVSEKDEGQSDAINKGFLKCTGDVVSWLCSDDLYMPGTLKKVNELFSTLPLTTSVIHGNSEIFHGKKIIRYDKGYGNWSVERQLAGMTFPQPSSFIRIAAWRKTGLLNTSLHYGMDYALFSKLQMISDFYYADEFLSRYRLHDQSKSTTAISKFIDEWIFIFNSIAEGLEIETILNVLKETGLKVPADAGIRKFFYEQKENKKPDAEKMIYYFMVNVIRYDYATGRFERARQIGSLLKAKYSNYLKSEPSILKIVNRVLLLPFPILRAARNVLRSISNE